MAGPSYKDKATQYAKGLGLSDVNWQHLGNIVPWLKQYVQSQPVSEKSNLLAPQVNPDVDQNAVDAAKSAAFRKTLPGYKPKKK